MEAKEYKNKWYAENREKVLKQQKEHNKSRKDEIRAYEKEWREKNKERIKEHKKKYYADNIEKIKAKLERNKETLKVARKVYNRTATLKLYSLEATQYAEMVEKQNGCCAICGIHQDNLSKVLHVDHNHKTNKNRGLLCLKCNMGIGYFNDNIESLNSAIEYLKKYE